MISLIQNFPMMNHFVYTAFILFTWFEVFNSTIYIPLEIEPGCHIS